MWPLITALLAIAVMAPQAWAAEDDAGVLRAHLIAHAGATAPTAPSVSLIGEVHRNVAVLAADQAGAHLHAGDFDATLPWRILDGGTLSALASPTIDQADDAVLTAWLRSAALATPRDAEFDHRLEHLRARAPTLAATVDEAMRSVASAKAASRPPPPPKRVSPPKPPVPQAPPGPETAELATLMCERGQLMIDNRMDQAAMDNDWQGFQPGLWTCEAGQGVKVTAVPGEHPPYRIRKFDLTDCVLQVSFKFDGVDEVGFGFDNDQGQHLMGCHLRPDSISLNRCPIIGKDRNDDDIAHATVKLERGVWHTLVWEIHGTEMLARVDDLPPVYGQVDGIDCYKTYTAFFTGAVPGKFIHVGRFRAWQAANQKSDWATRGRAKMLELTRAKR